MLAKKNRLSGKENFARLFQKGKRVNLINSRAWIKYQINGLNEPKIAFIIKKKFIKKAVDRNKIKRVLAGLLREKISKIKPGVILAVVWEGKSDQNKKIIDREQVSREMEKFFQKEKLLNKPQ